MSVLRQLSDGLRSLFRKEQVSKDFDAEFQSFVEMATEEKMRHGMTRAEAVRAVRLERGSIEVAKENVYAAGWESVVEGIWRDISFGVRSLRKSLAFSAIVVLTLTLGIGANTAIFTLLNAVMLESLPVPNPMQLYRLGDNNNCCSMTGTQDGGSFVLYSHPLYEYLRHHTPEFERLAAFASYLEDLSVRGPRDSAAQPYKGEFVSGNHFQMFGIEPSAGRLLTSFEQTGECHAISHAWISRRELRSERETASKTLRFRRRKREKAKFRFAVGPHGTLLGTKIEIDGRKVGNEAELQYSSGKSNVVTDRSASVITQIFSVSVT